MASPLIFNGRRAKMLTQDGILRADGSIIDNNGTPNLIKNGHAEINTTGWTVSKNTVAASRPDSGFVTSSTNITWTRNTTNPIDGQADFLYTKGAANRQGEQVYCGFTVAKKYRAKVLQIEVDYLVNSGTFSAGSNSTDSDIIVYIYDVTNSTFIEPSSFKFLSSSSTIADKFVANFQTSATGSSYRILFHQATTSASAFAVQFKDVRVSPCQYVYGTPISDWQSYSLTIGGSTSAPTVGTNTSRAIWRRVGDSMEIKYYLNQTGAGSAGSGTYLFPLPSGSTIDTNKATVTTNGSGLGGTALGAASAGNTTSSTSNNATVGTVIAYNTTNLAVQLLATTIGQTITLGSTNYALSGTTILYQFEASVPISGWSSSTQVSDGYDGRLIAAQATTASQTITAGGTRQIINGSTVTYDKTGSITTGASWKFTAPSQGIYEVKYVSSHSFATYTTGAELGAELYKNGSFAKPICNFMQQAATGVIAIISGSVEVELNANDYIDVREFIGGSVNSTINGATIYISKKQTPQTMSATEVVAAKYYGIPTGSIGSPHQTITYPTKAFDTHNAYSGGTYTIPVAGIYEVYAYVEIAGTESLNQSVNIATYKNGSVEDFMATTRAPGTVTNTGAGGSTLVNCVAGDTIQIKVFTDISSPSYVYADTTPRFTIKKIK